MNRKLICKISILLVFSFVVNYVFFDNVSSYTRHMMEEMYHYDGNIDVVFIGPSLAYRSFDPEMADGLLKRNTFNAGSSSQKLDGSYYLLKEICRDQNVKTVFLEIDHFNVVDPNASDGLQKYLLTDYMKINSPNTWDFLLLSGGVTEIANKLLPVMHLYTFNVRKIVDKVLNTERFRDYTYVTYDNEEYRGKGFVYSFGTVQENAFGAGDGSETYEISDFALSQLDQIVDFCRKSKIELVFVSTPVPDAYLCSPENYQKFVDEVACYAEEQDVRWYNFNLVKENVLRLSLNDFQDEVHLNGHGAEKFSEAICGVYNAVVGGSDLSAFFYESFGEKQQLNPFM